MEDFNDALLFTDETLLGDDDIVDFFKKHCECRPVDISRQSHSHDCDTLYTDLCKVALMCEGPVRQVARLQLVHYINNND